jgi:hypothetical protein
MNRYEKELKAIDEAMLKHVKGFEDDLRPRSPRRIASSPRTSASRSRSTSRRSRSSRREVRGEANLKTSRGRGHRAQARPVGLEASRAASPAEPHDRMFQTIRRASVSSSPTRRSTRPRSRLTVTPADGSRRGSRRARSRLRRRAPCWRALAAAAVRLRHPSRRSSRASWTSCSSR